MTTKRITKEEIKHVADLACLALSEEEIARFETQLSDILGHVAMLDEVDVTGITTPFQNPNFNNVYRDDVIKPSLSQEEALKNAPSVMNGYFKVKKVI